MPIKVIAFGADETLWRGFLDKNKFGKGSGAAPRLEDNLELVDDRLIRDRSDHQNYIKLFPDIPKIIHDICKRGIKIAIVSQNSSKALCDRALWHYKAYDDKDNLKPIISLVSFDEVAKDGKIQSFQSIKEWSQASYQDMLYFDSDPASKEIQQKLGVHVKLVNEGLKWEDYTRALESGGSDKSSDPYDIPYYRQPPLGKSLGQGKFGAVYDSTDDQNAVIKVYKYWSKETRHRFLEIYNIIKDGKPFNPGNNSDDQYILMIAFELRNLKIVGQLKAPDPEKFTGWFTMTKIRGTPLYKTPLYRKHPFSVTFQRLIKTAFHLIVDEIEYTVKKYGLEHRDAHLANAAFDMQDDWPVKAHLLDWGIAARMKWDGEQYIRGDDVLLWSDSEAGAKYTPEKFRKYWITWMVKTEYEANMSRNAITEKDGREFLKDLDWWFQR